MFLMKICNMISYTCIYMNTMSSGDLKIDLTDEFVNMQQHNWGIREQCLTGHYKLDVFSKGEFPSVRLFP